MIWTIWNYFKSL